MGVGGAPRAVGGRVAGLSDWTEADFGSPAGCPRSNQFRQRERIPAVTCGRRATKELEVGRGGAMSGFLNAVFRPLFVSVVLVQGIHVIEHIIQLVQVYVLGIPDEKALGILGYILKLQGTE